MTRVGLILSVTATLATGATAQDLRPAPDYFIEAMTSITTAENIAIACPHLSFDSARASETTAEVLSQLSADGFDAKNLGAGMADPGDAVRATQAAFRAKHGLAKDGTDFEAICAAGRAEMADGSPIGGFLIQITGAGAVDPTKDSSAQ